MADDDTKAAKTAAKRKRKADAARERAFDDVIGGQAPSLDGLDDLDTRVVVDPHDARPRTKIVALRDDPIGLMKKRGQISPLQMEGARLWQARYDVAEIGGARGIDPMRIKVDGGALADPNTDARLRAMKDLAAVDRKLGLVGAALIRRVLGERLSVAKFAAMLGDDSKRSVLHLGFRLRECLDTIVAHFGLTVKGGPRREAPDQHTSLAEYAHAPELHRAVRAARDA